MVWSSATSPRYWKKLWTDAQHNEVRRAQNDGQNDDQTWRQEDQCGHQIETDSLNQRQQCVVSGRSLRRR